MKVERVRQIAQLKQVMRRWRVLSLRRRLVEDPPPGFLAVYVGDDRRRFVIPARFLNLPVFAALLQRAEEEYGFPGSAAGGLALPCDPAFFGCVLDALHLDEARFRNLPLDAFLVLFADRGRAASSSPCRDSSSYNSFSPLLPKAKAR
ncbi:auxin-responsive protein SAUR23-like [Zingiber officinale]|uniref:Uncharacterized protein n=1 Tax=Zingiber officinale TaxID=94328 RepID=A0A8J5G8C1_ZINOF|nr:auxin-responsive protein SAUR23-like [Zingiber officinale]KAG6493840.1 hypothetical protein ZIOFF_048843 [Zingiber officinale]